MEAEPVFAADNRTVRLNGARLIELRRSLGMSREQLAERSVGAHRLSVATIKRAEGGVPVYLETARRLASLLGADTIDALTEGDETSTTHGGAVSSASVGVAVLPFRAVGPDPSARVVADGLTEDLTTRLGGSWFPVISYASVQTFGAFAPAERLDSDLAVAYLVQGSVQQSRDAVRVHARLLESSTHRALWSSEYNRPLGDLFRLQDELTCGIVDSVNHRLLELQVPAKPGNSLDDVALWQLIAQGSQEFYKYTPDANARARLLLRTAVERGQHTAHAWYLLALTYQQSLLQQWTSDPSATLRELGELNAEFRRLYPGEARADVSVAYSLIYQGRRGQAADHLERAIANGASLHTAYALLGQVRAMAGDAESAFEQLEVALRLNPRGPDLWVLKIAMALAFFVAEEYAECLAWAEAANEHCPNVAFPLVTIAAAAALSGDVPRAQAALHRMAAAGGRTGQLQLLLASTEPRIAARYLTGLRQSGLSI